MRRDSTPRACSSSLVTRGSGHWRKPPSSCPLLRLHLLDELPDLFLAHLAVSAAGAAHPTCRLRRKRHGIDRAKAIVGDLLEIRERVIFPWFRKAFVKA